MDEIQSTAATMYWCHMCNRRVEPVIQLETIECPLCQSGFVEQISHTSMGNRQAPPDDIFGNGEAEPDSDHSLSLWAPVLLGMMRRRRRLRRRSEFEYQDNHDDILSSVDEAENELDRELRSFTHTRRRNSAAVLQFLQEIHNESENNSENMDSAETRDRNRVVLINRSNQTIVLHGGNFRNRNINNTNNNNNNNNNSNASGSLGDYFVGPGLEMLLQHLAENDQNRHGTPPAKKEAVEAMPMVKIGENVQCSVCLDDLEMGTEAKEMPCKHKFHNECILPWLELHSSCPVCRYQLPCDGRKVDSDHQHQATNNSNAGNTNINVGVIASDYNGGDNSSSSSGNVGDNDNNNNAVVEEMNGRSENRRGFSVPWPFSNLFSSSGSSRGSSSSSSANATRHASSADEN